MKLLLKQKLHENQEHAPLYEQEIVYEFFFLYFKQLLILFVKEY